MDAVKHVDKIIPYSTEEELITIFSSLDLDVRIIGEEYKDKEFTGKQICEDRGIKIWYNSRNHRFSSSELRNRTYESEKKKFSLMPGPEQMGR